MPFNISLLLPNNLSSDLMKGEFIEQGQAYNTNRYHADPNTDQNKATLVFSFELRDSATRAKVAMTRIKQLILSNDPSFESSATITIVNLPDLSLTYDSTKNYTYYLNPSYFWDQTQAQEITPRAAPTSGSGYFYIYNWPLSANGGLSRVYMKAIIEGPGGSTATYPNDIGLYDQLLWQGEVPTAPQNPDFGVLKSGWTNSDALLTFNTSAESVVANYSNGVNGYLGSLFTVSSTGSTYNAYTVKSSTKRTLLPTASIGTSTFNSYRYYSDGTRNYSSNTFTIGSSIGLTSGTFGRGAIFYTATKFPYDSYKTDIYTQAAFNYSVSGIGVSSQAFIKLYDQPDYAANGKEIVVKLDIQNDSYVTSYLNTITAGTISAATQTTVLPSNILPSLQSGGLMEMYYSNIDSSYSYVEAYFTPYTDQSATSEFSYLIANAMVPSFGSTALGSAFGYQITGATGSTGTIKLDELVIANGKSKLSVDLGDCGLRDNNNNAFPISKITTNWSLYTDDEYKVLQEYPSGLTLTSSIITNYIEVSKMDSSAAYDPPATYEVQMLKPSMSNRTKMDFTLLHRSDDFYVAFSPISSYRSSTWDRPMGTRIDENYSYSDEPNNASTIMLKFSGDKNIIYLLQRNEDNTFTKHTLKTYTPSASADTWSIEITDQAPDGITGTKRRKAANSTWVYLKKSNGVNLELIGYAQLARKQHSNTTGLGYYASIGFRESTFNTGTNRLSSLSLYGLPKFFNSKSDNDEKVGTFLLADEGIANSKHYLGIKSLSSLTDLKGFNYTTPVNSYNEVSVELATTGTNIDVSNLSSATIDGIAVSTISSGKYILVKDQNTASENGVYYNAGTSWTFFNVSYGVPLRIVQGTINASSTWYKKLVQLDSSTVDRYVCTTFFKDMTIGEISPFISNIVPGLLQFKMNWNKYDTPFAHKRVRVRFFSNSNGYPTTALTSWLTPSVTPIRDTIGAIPGNDLVQVYLDYTTLTSLSVAQGNTIWVAIDVPMGTSLAEAYGVNYTNSDQFSTGLYSGYSQARNLWHKLYARRTDKTFTYTNLDLLQYKLRSLSHANISSISTALSSEVKIDKSAPSYNSDVPQITFSSNTSVRAAVINILATDSDSGIMSFRVGREIDDQAIEYTPWMSWDKFKSGSYGLYSIYMNGHYNYNYLGAVDTSFQSQNVGYSGARKIWVQIMDFAGNVSETYPVTFVAKTWMMVDTVPPYGNVNFYDPESDSNVLITNGSNMGGLGSINISSWVKIDANDLVSGVKDFKFRRVRDTGPDAWSPFEKYDLHRIIDFTGEIDGVKKIEVAFRDYGNNIVQPEISWKKVLRPRK